MHVVVYGAGSLGSLLGALLARTPDHEVTLVGRDPHVSAVRTEGLRVTGTEAFTVHPDATTEGTDIAGDLALVTVKAFDTPEAAHDLATGTFETVCSLQNGMGNEDVLAEHLECPILAGTTGFGAVLSAPGEVVWNGGGDVVVGPWTPPEASDVAEDAGAAFATAGVPVTVEGPEGIREQLWEKLAVNAAVNPTTALARVENGALGSPPGDGLVEPVAREVARTARAAGVDLGERAALDAIERVVGATADNESSMYRDVQRGCPTEIGVINGYVVETAAEYGIEVPVNRTLSRLVRTWEAGHADREN